MKKSFDEFKAFAMRGNVMDLAVGVIIGTAFGKIITSIVNDLVMPIISILIGRVNFSDLRIVLSPASEDAAEVAFRYGSFIQTALDFLIISISIFIIVKVINKFRRKKEEEPAKAPVLSHTEELLTQIRDILSK